MKSIQKLMMVMLLAAVVNTAYAQDIETVVDSVKSNLKNDDLKDAVSNIKDAFKIKEATVDMMVGKWRYVEPAVYATKGNVLFKLVGNTVANQLEKILDDFIEKCNITPENSTFTFYKNGTFYRNVAGHKAHGVWLVGREKLILGINNILTAEITTHHDGDKLMFLIDVDKLMHIFKLLGAIEDTKTNEKLIKLTKKIPTLQAGLSFQKVKGNK
jgi:hypothetical protein